jgi:glutathione S-transferase
MPVDPNAEVEVTAFDWVPDFARTYVRDFRVRWALEEAGIPYRTRLISAVHRPHEYFHEQPFGQVPAYRDAEVQLFESAAIVLHVGRDCETLLPSEPAARARATAWTIAALNSVEPFLMELAIIDIFAKGEEWAKLRRPSAIETIRKRLGQLADALGTRDYLEDRFTAADLIMASVLRGLDKTGLLEEHATLAAYQRRCLDRPGFAAAIEAQLADFTADAPQAA